MMLSALRDIADAERMRDLRPYGLNPKSLKLFYAEQLPYRVTVNDQRCHLGMKAWSEHLEGRISNSCLAAVQG